MNPFRRGEHGRGGLVQQIQSFFENLGPSPVKSLKAAISNNDEVKAVQIYLQRHRNGVCLQQDMHPSLPLQGCENGDTPLHLAAMAAMKARAAFADMSPVGEIRAWNLTYALLWDLVRQDLLLLFLDRGGNPNTANGLQETALHCVCKRSDSPAERLFCLEALLSWRGVEINGECEGVAVNAVDSEGNTPLHLAARSGLADCVDKLLSRGAVISLVNRDQMTACDVAHANNHIELANRLECEMVFESPPDEVSGWLEELSTPSTFVSPNVQTSVVAAQVLSWLDGQLDDAARVMSLPIEHAEACLEVNDWNLPATVQAFTSNAEELLRKAKLRREDADDTTQSGGSACAICADPVRAVPAANLPACEDEANEGDESERKLGLQVRCGHTFCLECLSGNLAVQLKEGVGVLRCPGYNCGDRIPLHWLPMVLHSQEDIDKFFANRVRTVVDCSPNFSWCRHAGCEWILKYEHNDGDWQEGKEAENAAPAPCNVLCASAHAYCSACGDQPHAPCPCDSWKEWLQLVQEETAKTGESKGDAQDIADALWISANTKRCPKCTAPIEKNEGCNHMTCRKCRHEFCWICMQPWSLHDASTGGFFQCNRFREQETDDAESREANLELGSAQAETQRMRERADHMARFIHHYTRWHAHGQSAEMEAAMKETTIARMRDLIVLHTRMRATSRLGGGASEAKLQDESVTMDEATVGELIAGFMELIRSRLVLRGSFAYAFFEFSSAKTKSKRRRGLLRGHEKYRLQARREAFERAQSDLEQVVEMLSDVVARKRLRASKIQLQVVTSATRTTRMAFERLIKRDQAEEAELAAAAPPTEPRRERRSRRRERAQRRQEEEGGDDVPDGQRILRALLQSLQANGFGDQGIAQALPPAARRRPRQAALTVDQIPVRERSDDEVSSESSAGGSPDWFSGQFPPPHQPLRPNDVIQASRWAARAEEESALEQAILASFQDLRMRTTELAPPPREAVEALQAMGFSEEQSIQALQRTNGDVQAAVNILLSA